MDRITALAKAVELHESCLRLRQDARDCMNERNEALLELWRNGVQMAELAAALGVTVQAISHALGQPTGRTWTVEKNSEESSQTS